MSRGYRDEAAGIGPCRAGAGGEEPAWHADEILVPRRSRENQVVSRGCLSREWREGSTCYGLRPILLIENATRYQYPVRRNVLSSHGYLSSRFAVSDAWFESLPVHVPVLWFDPSEKLTVWQFSVTPAKCVPPLNTRTRVQGWDTYYVV